MLSSAPIRARGDALNHEVVVDRERCIGSQNCVHHAPSLFQIDDEGLAVTIAGGEASDAQLELAARDCPTEAIQLRRVDPR
jgi:ferredoxin